MDERFICRAKRIEDGKWTQGYLFKNWGRAFLLWGTLNDVPVRTEVVPETVCANTGLHGEKDDWCGKVAIFECDILLCKRIDDGRDWCGVVEWRNGCFVVRDADGNALAIDCLSDYKIIGNLRDKPHA